LWRRQTRLPGSVSQTGTQQAIQKPPPEETLAFAAQGNSIGRWIQAARREGPERAARAKGFAIGTGAAFDVTVDAVASWIAEAKKRGIEIVPVSAVASDPERG
jgi:polysaccharide deacetylase 2 family uncharacterized protein YibQ